MPKAAIIIPIYTEPSELEAISLQQCFSILGAYPIVFVAPQRLENSGLHLRYNDRATFTFLPDSHFESVHTYNELLLSVFFYKLFIDYDYILIYQPDCFVFRDELQYWVEKGYSYIGAPWFAGNSNDPQVDTFIGVGNGGFSLRKVDDCIKVLQSARKVWPFRMYLQQKRRGNILIHWLKSAKRYLFSDSFKTVSRNRNVNEDKIFSAAGKRLGFFKIPLPEEALSFSFEMQPEKLYSMNNQQLPFGCHAWWRYDLEFYIAPIQEFGHDLNLI